MTNDQLNEIWDNITNNGWATEEQLALITGINGFTLEAMNQVLWFLHGLDYDQLND